MPINAAWHGEHPMPKNPSLDQRIAWHEEHARECACRPIPKTLLEQMRKKGASASRGAPFKRALPRETAPAAPAPPPPAAPRPPSAPSGSGARARPSAQEAPLRDLLSGEDRRSLAESNRARALIEDDPSRLPELVALTEDPDWLVRLRALDVLEKLAQDLPRRIEPHKAVFIGPAADSEQWEIQLQIVRALPLFSWTPEERARAAAILIRNLEHPQKFVRAWSLDSLATFAASDPALLPIVDRTLTAFEKSDAKALVSRARQIRARLRR